MTEERATGHVVVNERKSGRVWVAQIKGPAGRTRKVLGPAWVRDVGKKTPRGATVWRAAPGSRPDATYLTPGEAQAELERLLAEHSGNGASIKKRSDGRTWGDVYRSYLDHAEHDRGVAASTLSAYRSQFASMDREGVLKASMPLRLMTVRKVEAAQAAMLRSELARKTVHNRMLAVTGALAHGATRGWIARTLPGDLSMISAPAPHPDFNVLEPSQVEAVARALLVVPEAELPLVRGSKGQERGERAIHQGLLEQMEQCRAVWAEVVRFAAYTGLRLGEIRSLEWADVDFAHEVVRVVRNHPSNSPALAAGERAKVPKGSKPRGIPLIPQAAAAADRASKLDYVSTGQRDLVFPTIGGGMLQGKALREAFYSALGEIGLGWMREQDRPIVFHDLRHTFGTIAVRVFPISDVQEYMGHADIATTMRYVHHVPRADAAKKLGDAFSTDLVSDAPVPGVSVG